MFICGEEGFTEEETFAMSFGGHGGIHIQRLGNKEQRYRGESLCSEYSDVAGGVAGDKSRRWFGGHVAKGLECHAQGFEYYSTE